MNHSEDQMTCVLCTCASERDNPYDQHKQPKEHAAWREAYRAVRRERGLRPGGQVSGAALKEDAATAQEQCQFALIWRPYPRPFRLRVNDVIRVDGRLGRVIRVTECAAVVLVQPPAREFRTRFDKRVRFQPKTVTIRISANSETEIVNRRPRLKPSRVQTERRSA